MPGMVLIACPTWRRSSHLTAVLTFAIHDFHQIQAVFAEMRRDRPRRLRSESPSSDLGHDWVAFHP